MKRPHVGRWLGLLLALAASGVAVLALAGPWLPPGDRPEGFAGHVIAACAVALVGCWAWLALGAVVVAVQTSIRPPALPGRRLVWVPGVVRVLVPAALGVAVTAAPAVAAPVPGPGPTSTTSSVSSASTTGLPLPDRTATTPDRPRTGVARQDLPRAGVVRPRTVVVRAGDTLWSIAADLLPGSTADAVVDATWRRLARANAERVPDPHLIHPGTRLRVPSAAVHTSPVHPSPVHPREEAP